MTEHIIINTSRRQGKRYAQREVLKAFKMPRTLVVSDENYNRSKDFYKDCHHITIMSVSEAFKEQELISDYYYGEGILLEPKLFNPRASFEHIRKKK